MKFGWIVLQLNMRRLTESDFRYDVILLRWQPCHHCNTERRGDAAAYVLNGLAGCLQFLIHSAFVLVKYLRYLKGNAQ